MAPGGAQPEVAAAPAYVRVLEPEATYLPAGSRMPATLRVGACDPLAVPWLAARYGDPGVHFHHARCNSLAGLVRRFAARKTIVADLADAADGPDLSALAELGEVVRGEEGRITLTVPRARTAAAIGQLLATAAVTDMTVSEPPIDEVIERVFAEASDADGG